VTVTARALVAGVALLLAAEAVRPLSADDLRAVEHESTLQLTTSGRRTGQSRAVTIWFVRDRDRIYVQSGKEGQTDWYRNLVQNPSVVVQLGGLKLRGHARPIDDAAETARVHELFSQKYLSARVMGWVGGGFGHGKVVLIDGLEPVT